MDSYLMCSDSIPTILGVFDPSIAPSLLYYSYIPIVILSLCIGLYVLFKDNFSKLSKSLLGIIVVFSVFLINEIVLWIAAPVGLITFSWSLAPLLRILISIATLYFIFTFIEKREPGKKLKYTTVLLALPIIILLPTSLNVNSFDLTNCEGVNGPLWYYLFFFEALCLIFLLYKLSNLIYRKFVLKNNIDKIHIYLASSAFIFLLIFNASQIFGELFGDYEINLFGPIGFLIFIISLSYITIKYKVFSIKMLAPISLVFTLWILVFSLLFINDPITIHYIVGATLVPLGFTGYALIKSVKTEVSIREQAQKLAEDLKRANERLKELDKAKSEFVSIASHQLRSPITAISGYASLMREGDYGSVPEKMRDPLERIESSARMMASSIEDYLNVSRIESGNMKYNYSDFNLKDEVEHVCDDLRPIALKQGLVLLFKQNVSGMGIIKADIGKTQQIVHNLINNSIKYTPKGTITVYVHDSPAEKKMFVDIIDTGIGMNEETLGSIFGKFTRAKNANAVNVKGTGLGLFVALKMAQAMSGNITAHSTGEGQGSTFTLEMKLG